MDDFEHWRKRPLRELHWAISVLATDAEAFSYDNRKAILQVTALTLGKLVRDEKQGA